MSPDRARPAPPRAEPARGLIADAQPLFSRALAQAMSSDPRFQIEPSIPRVWPEALQALRKLQPGFALLDYWMAGMEPLEAIGLARRRARDSRLVVLSWYHSVEQIAAVQEMGALFVPKSVGLADLCGIVQGLLEGDLASVELRTRRLIEKISGRAGIASIAGERLRRLTTRELELLFLISKGHQPKQISRMLDIKPSTLKTHVNNMLAKTAAGSRGQLVALARSCGFISP